jgi:hypothetical protein
LSIIQDNLYKKIPLVTLCNLGTGTTHTSAHNIFKIQLKIVYGFCRNIDLGILHFYFSSKNCSSKAYTYLERVVVLVTLSIAKLCLLFLGFFTIFNQFYKFQPIHSKGERIFLRQAPWNFSKHHRPVPSVHKTPWKTLGLCNVVQVGQGRRDRPDSGETGGGGGREIR